MPEFYPTHLPVPLEKRTARLFLRQLREADAALDYEALMSSVEFLRCWSQSDWPPDDFTLAQNAADLERHERKHHERKSFAFTVLDPEGARCLGCVYLEAVPAEERPLCESEALAVDVGFWVRTSELASGLEEHLLAVLREWLAAEWVFACVLFPVWVANGHQAALLAAAGLAQRLTCRAEDGRVWLVFGQA